MNEMCPSCGADLKGGTRCIRCAGYPPDPPPPPRPKCDNCGMLRTPSGRCPQCSPVPFTPQSSIPADLRELRFILDTISNDLEPLRNGSYSDGIKQLAFRLKEENAQLRKENAELAAQLKSVKAAVKDWEALFIEKGPG